MSSAIPFENKIVKYAATIAFLFLVLGAGIILKAAYLPVLHEDSHPSKNISWITDQNIQDKGWENFHSKYQNLVKNDSVSGDLSVKYRLAGVFFDLDARKDTRKAIIDNNQSGIEAIVAEGDSFGDIIVTAIYADHILIRDINGVEDQLWLKFDKISNGQASNLTGINTNQRPRSTDKFGGKRIGEDRWVFERSALLNYYQELRNEPERLVKVFDSLKPVYDDNRKITGYRLNTEGEREFFAASGLKENDVIKTVNSLKMTSRNRAEYLIKEFIDNRLNDYHFEVERDGKPMLIIYNIKEQLK